jgi:hypothetical protein
MSSLVQEYLVPNLFKPILALHFGQIIVFSFSEVLSSIHISNFIAKFDMQVKTYQSAGRNKYVTRPRDWLVENGIKQRVK